MANEHLILTEKHLQPLGLYWLKAMQKRRLAARYITANPQQWPQSFQTHSRPVPLGTYGHSEPFSLEDTMYIFDRLARLHPLSVHYFALSSPQTARPEKKQKPLPFPQSLIDRFFCAYLTRYLEIPFYFFEVSLKAESSAVRLSARANSDDLKHFVLYLDKNEEPSQEKVKQWIRQVYR